MPAFSAMECSDEDIEEARQINIDQINDDVDMLDVLYDNEEPVGTHWKDLHNHQNPFDSDDSFDDYDFLKYKKRSQSRSSSEGGDEDEESQASDYYFPHSLDDDEEGTNQDYEFEQGAPLSPIEEYDDGAINNFSPRSYSDYGNATYEYDDDGDAMCKDGRTRANRFDQREPSPLAEDPNDGSINSDDENDFLDKDYVPNPLDKDDEDCLAEINSDSDNFEDQEDNDFLYRELFLGSIKIPANYIPIQMITLAISLDILTCQRYQRRFEIFSLESLDMTSHRGQFRPWPLMRI